MASRFFVASSSDYEEEEQQNENQLEEEEEETEKKESEENKPQKSKASRFFDDYKTSDKRVVRSEKQKRWADLRNDLGKVLDELAVPNYKHAFELFQKLVKTTDKSKKAIDENGYPNFFILGMSDMQSIVKENVDTQKDLRRFNNELDKFIVPFEDLIKQAKLHPEDFVEPEEEEDDDELGFGNMDDSSSDDEDDGPGKWFMSSDDEDKEDQDKKKERKEKIIKKSADKDYAEMIEERLNESKNELITNESAKMELEKAIKNRVKGKITTTTDRLSVLMIRVDDAALKHDIMVEICFTIMQGPADTPISLNDWRLALNILPNLTKDAENIVPLFERLNRDFWARSVDPRVVFTAETAKLHTFLQEFLALMIRFTDILEEEGKNNYCTRIQILILEHNYHELAPTYDERMKKRSQMSAKEIQNDEKNQQLGLKARTPRELCRSILMKVPEEGMFDANTTLGIRVRAMLYYAIHLAYNGHPETAEQLVACLPDIPAELPFVRILCNRAFAEIGIAAFMTGNYRLCYSSLKSFTRTNAPRLLGQHPRIYAPWLYIDPGALETYLFLSAMILDIPCLTTFNFDERDVPISAKLHKELQKKVGIAVCPETIMDKIAVAIERCKRGEWQLAKDILHYEIERYIPRPEGFIKDLKLMSLCSFLLTANQFYDAVQIDTLMKQFDLEKDIDPITGQEIVSRDVDNCLSQMQRGRSPVGNVPLFFDAQIDQGFVSFMHTEKETPLADFGRTLRQKCEGLQHNIQELKPDNVDEAGY
jgi:translation initiation factor 3 subunit C